MFQNTPKEKAELGLQQSGSQSKVVEKMAQCESKWAPEEVGKVRQLSSVTGLKGLFTDPFGVRRAKYRSELSGIRAEHEGCVANAPAAVMREVQEELNRPK